MAEDSLEIALKPTAPACGGERKRILLLEDEAIVAMMLEDMLDELGYAITGPAHSVDGALRLIDDERFDAAILDINVGGESSRAVADRLQGLGVPFAFATGYSSAPPQSEVGAPLLQKPYFVADVRRLLDGLLGSIGGAGTAWAGG